MVTEAAWQCYSTGVVVVSAWDEGCSDTELSNGERGQSSRGPVPDAMPINAVHVAGFNLPANQSLRD